jgi:hypothetical protein
MTTGSKLKALDNPPFANDYEGTDETTITSTYSVGTATCGTTFVAPTSGIVVVFWSARVEVATSAGFIGVTVQVASGSTIGSGAVVAGNGAAADNSCIETRRGTGTAADTRIQASMFRIVTGLTPGATYNAVVMHRGISGAIAGTVYERGIMVMAMPS